MRRTSKALTVEQLESRLVPAGNIIVTNNQNLQVYSTTGDLISSTVIPLGPGGDTPARDLIAAFNLAAEVVTHVYNGTQAEPFMSTQDAALAWSHLAGETGWSTDTESETGGIAAFTNYVFATDMDISGDGNGIVRWDLTDNSSLRFASGTDFVDLTIGLDGNLYALTPNSGTPPTVHVYNPNDMGLLDTITLPADDFSGIAVDEDGRIYATALNNPDIYRFGPDGTQQRHRRLKPGDLNNLIDIDVSNDGWLIMGTKSGDLVRLKVSNFTGNNGSELPPKTYKRIQILDPNGVDPADGPTFVAFQDPQEIVLPHVTISGRKFNDLNSNGVRNINDPGLAGITIFADLDESGSLDLNEPFTVTDAQGRYSIDVLLSSAVSFRLMEQRQLGWAQTFEAAATAEEPTLAHPWYTLLFADGDQNNLNFGNHVANFTVTPVTVLNTAENGFTASFTVVLSAAPTSEVTIPVSSSNSNEGTVAITELTFTSLNWNVPQTVTVTGQGDGGAFDGNASYTIELGASVSLDVSFNGLPGQSVTLTNFDTSPIDKVGIFRAKPRRWTLDAFNDGVYSAGRDIRLTGLGGGKTLVGDWNGDGYDDLGLFNSKTGVFTLIVDGAVFMTVNKLDGLAGGKPLVGNWNAAHPGDEIGIFRNGSFTLDLDGDGATNDLNDAVGGQLDGKTAGTPLVGDWDGDGDLEVGIYRAKNGVFTLDVDLDLVAEDLDDTVINKLAGRVGGRPMVGNWDGVGGDNVGLFFSLTGKWFLDTNNDALVAEILINRLDGKVGGIPIVGDFNGDAITDRGIFRSKPGKWTIDLNNDGNFNLGVDHLYKKVDGQLGGKPLVGKWDLPTP